jgi:hypothetical protein
MNSVLVNNGKAEIQKDGITVSSFGHGEIICAEFNSDQSLILCVTDQGKVELRKENGSVHKSVATNAVYATFEGHDVMVTTMKGKVELRKENGNLIKVLE